MLVLKSKSMRPGVVLHASLNVVRMGIFHEMTVRKVCASYLPSESGVFLGLVYILAAVARGGLNRGKPGSGGGAPAGKGRVFHKCF